MLILRARWRRIVRPHARPARPAGVGRDFAFGLACELFSDRLISRGDKRFKFRFRAGTATTGAAGSGTAGAAAGTWPSVGPARISRTARTAEATRPAVRWPD